MRKRVQKAKRKARLGKQIAHLGLLVRGVEKEEEQDRLRRAAKRARKTLEQHSTRKVGRHLFEVRMKKGETPSVLTSVV